ncbi:MAG: NRPS, partial [Chrysothrix sp. TS-e1954]
KSVSSQAEVTDEYEALKSHVFDLESGKLMRVILLSLSPTTSYLLFNYHHILMDGVSYQLFLSDLEKAYKGQTLGKEPRQFLDCSVNQRASFSNGSMDADLRFWRAVFPEPPPVLPLLPMAQSSTRVAMKAFDTNQVEIRLSSSLTSRVKQVAKGQRSTPFHLYLAVFKTMLFRFLNDTTDLTIGIADANRNEDDVSGTIGLFLNLLTLRFVWSPEQSFIDAVGEARNKTFAALSHSRLPFDVLLKELNVPRSSTYSPFFQAFFDYRQGAKERHEFGNCQFEVQAVHPGRTAYDITLDVTDSAAGTLIMVRTQKTLYNHTATRLLVDSYVHLLEKFCEQPNMALQRPSLYGEKQLQSALELGRGTNIQSDWPTTLPHRIDQMIEQNPDSVALKDGLGRVLTYKDMSMRIQAISEELLKQGIGDGACVAVFQQATSDWVCSLLSIMRIGAVYVPLDLRNPLPRLADVVRNCHAEAILADGTTIGDASELKADNAKKINVSVTAQSPRAHVPNSAQPEAPAAILYTSGSTGVAKGIVIRHAGLRNEQEGYTKTWKLGAERVLQQSAFTFNHSSDQIFTGLVNGGMVYIVPWAKRGDPLEVTKLIEEQEITYTKATPSEYVLWLQYGKANLQNCNQWRFAFGGGEPLSTVVTDEFASLDLSQLHFYNSYGPAEITISSTKMEIQYRDAITDDRVPCGYSLPNYTAYILDEQLKPVPAGYPGEIVIGGAGVALGYLSNKSLTDAHFVNDPYAPSAYVANGWTKMYRTGDIGHLREDGALVFHNRVAGDTQIKIRGLRIELGDIESNIVRASRGVLREAVVTLREGDPVFLVAHVVFTSAHGVANQEDYLQHLLQHLPIPQYMIPVMAVPLERILLSGHAKVDRKAIKALPLLQRSGAGHVNAELTDTMVQLKYVWQDCLANNGLGFDITASTSFFSVGGNSLLIVRLQSRIRDVFKVVVRLVELLGGNTLAEMAQKIEEGLSVREIDWKEETALPAINLTRPSSSPSLHEPPKVILITGATGFLAQYLLPLLVNDPTVTQIHCLAVRPKGADSPRKLSVASPKLVTHAGDLSAPLLGLSKPIFQALAADADRILHMGAIRSFWDNYSSLRPSNVTPTKELVRLAAARRIPIHYISSAGVLPEDSSAARLAASVAPYEPPIDGTNGYVASRWASEQVLERAAAQLGVPTHIHRFVAAQTARNADPRPVLRQFARFVDETRLVPELEGWKGQFEMLSAETAAEMLRDAVVMGLTPSPAPLAAQFVHHECDISIDVAAMRRAIEVAGAKTGFERINGLKWTGRIKQLGFGYFFASQDVILKREAEGQVESLESRR